MPVLGAPLKQRSKTAVVFPAARQTDHLRRTMVAGEMATNTILIPAAEAPGAFLRFASGGAARQVRWGARPGREWGKPTVIEPSSGCVRGIRACRLYVAFITMSRKDRPRWDQKPRRRLKHASLRSCNRSYGVTISAVALIAGLLTPPAIRMRPSWRRVAV